MERGYQVKLDSFEGPLDLLLHLINRYEIDIYDIPVAQITEQYMQYIHTMQYLELNIASEYLVMAATLLAIKSQMLLPKQEITEEDTEEYMEDPREELMNRLIEYRKYKEAADKLKEREQNESQIFTRSPHLFNELEIKPTVVQGDISIYDMIGALGKMFERKKWQEPLETKVRRAEIPIGKRMDEIYMLVSQASGGIQFDDLFSFRNRSYIVVSFIAILELIKEKKIYCKQTNHFDAIFLYMCDNHGMLV